MKAKLDALNTEFEPKNNEIKVLRDRIQNLNNQIQTQGGTVQPAVRAQWADEASEKEKQLKRLGEDTEALAKRRFEEVGNPVQEKILRFLENYARLAESSWCLKAVPCSREHLCSSPHHPRISPTIS
jgi:Skp family chaperone for outer membrane proteins